MKGWLLKPRETLGIFLLATVSTPVLGQQNSTSSSPVSDFGGATPLNEAEWFPGYPVQALRVGAEGRVVVSFEIGKDGRASNCEVIQETSNRSLNRAPCPVLERVARFRPLPT